VNHRFGDSHRPIADAYNLWADSFSDVFQESLHQLARSLQTSNHLLRCRFDDHRRIIASMRVAQDQNAFE
jgi:hypothetical protein